MDRVEQLVFVGQLDQSNRGWLTDRREFPTTSCLAIRSRWSSNAVNSIVDSDITISSLVFTNFERLSHRADKSWPDAFDTGTAPGYQSSPALNVGLEGYTSSNQFIRAAITGSGGTLAISNTSATVQVRVGFSNNVVGPLAVLDLSGLGTFNANMNHFQIGVESGRRGGWRACMYLARTNKMTLVQADNVNANLTSGNPALYLGHNTQTGVTNGSALYLGVSNAVLVNFIVIGRGNQTNNVLAFNPAFLTNSPYAAPGFGRRRPHRDLDDRRQFRRQPDHCFFRHK